MGLVRTNSNYIKFLSRKNLLYLISLAWVVLARIFVGIMFIIAYLKDEKLNVPQIRDK